VFTGSTIPLEVESTDTIRDVKEKILDNTTSPNSKIKWDMLTLICSGKHLEDDKFVSNYDVIKENSTINVVVKQKHREHSENPLAPTVTVSPAAKQTVNSLPSMQTSFKILVNMINPLKTSQFSLEVERSDTIRGLKDKIHGLHKDVIPPPDSQRIIFGGRTWMDGERIQTWQSGATINVLPILPASQSDTITIDVQSSKKDTFGLQVELRDTIRQVKWKIYNDDVSLPPPDEQQIMFGGRLWSDHERIHTWPHGRSTGITIQVYTVDGLPPRRLANQRLIDRFIRESIRCIES